MFCVLFFVVFFYLVFLVDFSIYSIHNLQQQRIPHQKAKRIVDRNINSILHKRFPEVRTGNHPHQRNVDFIGCYCILKP
jgi:hypothetical protein